VHADSSLDNTKHKLSAVGVQFALCVVHHLGQTACDGKLGFTTWQGVAATHSECSFGEWCTL
jgi:hypothetical protein